jgi:hypothetical protein
MIHGKHLLLFVALTLVSALVLLWLQIDSVSPFARVSPQASPSVGVVSARPFGQKVDRSPASASPSTPGHPVRGLSSLFQPNPLQPGRLPDPFEGMPVLAREDGPADREGRFFRLKILRTRMMYPLVRVVERRRRDPHTGEETLLQKSEMVADHVMLRLEPGYTQEDLERLAERLDMKIRKAPVYSKIYLVSFELGDTDGVMLRSLDRTIALLKASRVVAAPEPDFIVHSY